MCVYEHVCVRTVDERLDLDDGGGRAGVMSLGQGDDWGGQGGEAGVGGQGGRGGAMGGRGQVGAGRVGVGEGGLGGGDVGVGGLLGVAATDGQAADVTAGGRLHHRQVLLITGRLLLLAS